MAYYDLYEIQAKTLEEARETVEKALEIVFSVHESSYHGGKYYRLNDIDQENFILQNNYDPFENEWFEDEFKEAKSLLYVNKTDRKEEIKCKLKACAFLLRSEKL